MHLITYKRPLKDSTCRNLQCDTAVAWLTGTRHRHDQWLNVRQGCHKGPQRQCFHIKRFWTSIPVCWHDSKLSTCPTTSCDDPAQDRYVRILHLRDRLRPATATFRWDSRPIQSTDFASHCPKATERSQSSRVALGADWTSPLLDNDNVSPGLGATFAGRLHDGGMSSVKGRVSNFTRQIGGSACGAAQGWEGECWRHGRTQGGTRRRRRTGLDGNMPFTSHTTACYFLLICMLSDTAMRYLLCPTVLSFIRQNRTIF